MKYRKYLYMSIFILFLWDFLFSLIDEKYSLISFYLLMLCLLISLCSAVELIVLNMRTVSVNAKVGIEKETKSFKSYIYVFLILLSLTLLLSNTDILISGLKTYK